MQIYHSDGLPLSWSRDFKEFWPGLVSDGRKNLIFLGHFVLCKTYDQYSEAKPLARPSDPRDRGEHCNSSQQRSIVGIWCLCSAVTKSSFGHQERRLEFHKVQCWTLPVASRFKTESEAKCDLHR